MVGTLQKNQNFGFVIPDNLRFDSDIFVSKSQCKNLTSGFKVMVEITDYGDARRSPEGKIIEVLGHKMIQELIFYQLSKLMESQPSLKMMSNSRLIRFHHRSKHLTTKTVWISETGQW